jgi:hypothetical protein
MESPKPEPVTFKSLETFLTTGACVYEMSTLLAGAGSTARLTETNSFMYLSTPEDVRHWTDEKLTQRVSRHAVDPKRTRLVIAADNMDNEIIVFDVVGMNDSLIETFDKTLIGTRAIGFKVTSGMVSTPVEEASSVDI